MGYYEFILIIVLVTGLMIAIKKELTAHVYQTKRLAYQP